MSASSSSTPLGSESGNGARVCYRLPDASDYIEICTKRMPQQIFDIAALQGKEGFVFAPFELSDSSPLWLIHADAFVEHSIIASGLRKPVAERSSRKEERRSYEHAFAQCSAALRDGSLEKIVLSRTATFRFLSPLRAEDRHALFLEACSRYPRCFVSLVELPDPFGAWLMATPEVLAESGDGLWHTMALAGTSHSSEKKMEHVAHWSEKNRHEQALVADYIRARLSGLSPDLRETSVYVRRAASLLHLCTDFYVPASDRVTTGSFVSLLHPTPAVCGTPMSAAQRLLSRVESHDRAYYSGFSGPMTEGETHFFVNLRCAHLHSTHATLFSGGGLLADSDLESEWRETERKLAPMADLFDLTSHC